MAYPYSTYPSYQSYQQYGQNYPAGYQPAPQPIPTAPPVPTTQPIQSVQPMQPQIQNGGFISVRGIEEAQRYPVAPGNAVTFKIEGLPIVCEKSQGFSQLEAPRFDVFDLVKRDMPVNAQEAQTGTENEQAQNLPHYALKEEIEPLRQGFEVLKGEVLTLKEQLSDATAKKSTAKAKKEEKDGDE